MLSRHGIVKMYYFVIDFEAKPLAPPQGWEVVQVFEELALALSH
jgi:hypothetical protein